MVRIGGRRRGAVVRHVRTSNQHHVIVGTSGACRTCQSKAPRSFSRCALDGGDA